MEEAKKHRKRIISALLVIAAFALGYRSDTSAQCLGDRLFQALGLSPWIEGRFRIHVPLFPAVLLLSLGYQLFHTTLRAERGFRESSQWLLLYLLLLALLVTLLA